MPFYAAAIAAVSLFGTAEAAVFNLQTGNGVNNGNGTYTFSVDGINLTVSAGLFGNAANAVIVPGADNSRVVQTNVGLGVTDNGDTTSDIDGLGDNDALIFAFDRLVRLDYIDFSNVDLTDDADFFFEQGGQLVRNSAALISVELGLNPLLDLAVLISLFPTIDPHLFIGTLFGVGADADGILGLFTDDFKIKRLFVTDLSGPNEVPLPAALPLFLAGLAGFRFAAKKRATPIG